MQWPIRRTYTCSCTLCTTHVGLFTRRYHVLAVDTATAGLPLYSDDLYPPPTSGATFVHRDWHQSPECIDGADALTSGCVAFATATPGQSTPLLALNAGMEWPLNGTHTTQLHTITPAGLGTWVLLGELDKFVCVSSVRFSQVTATPTRLTAAVAGAEGEQVHVTALRPNGRSWVVSTTTVRVGAGGTGRLCLPKGAQCA